MLTPFRSRWPIWDMVSIGGWLFRDRPGSAGDRLNAGGRANIAVLI